MKQHIDDDRFYKAVYEVVFDAVWGMITNNTMMPGHDFYETIEQAAQNAFEGLVINVERK